MQQAFVQLVVQLIINLMIMGYKSAQHSAIYFNDFLFHLI